MEPQDSLLCSESTMWSLLSKLNPVHALISNFFNTRFNIIACVLGNVTRNLYGFSDLNEYLLGSHFYTLKYNYYNYYYYLDVSSSLLQFLAALILMNL
jgi:hypothetical protein